VGRVRDQLLLTLEHRASAHAGLPLHQDGDALALRVQAGAPAAPAPDDRPSPAERILAALAPAPLTRRAAGRIRTASLTQALATLCADGRVVEHHGRLALPHA
jgi:hypothetical protein